MKSYSVDLSRYDTRSGLCFASDLSGSRMVFRSRNTSFHRGYFELYARGMRVAVVTSQHHGGDSHGQD